MCPPPAGPRPLPPRSAGWPDCCRRTCGPIRSRWRQTGSTPGSRRCGGATPTGSATIPRPRTRCAAAIPSGTPANWTSRRMNEAARPLVGEHDFAAFCRRREGASTVRNLIRLNWARQPSGEVVAEVVADAFCHNMVRALVGALLAAGDGRRPAGMARPGARRPGSVTRRCTWPRRTRCAWRRSAIRPTTSCRTGRRPPAAAARPGPAAARLPGSPMDQEGAGARRPGSVLVRRERLPAHDGKGLGADPPASGPRLRGRTGPARCCR